MQNRTRNKQLNLKFTENELNYFKKKKEISKVNNYTDFLLKTVANCRIYVIDTKPLLILANEVNKIGVNINQIAKVVNTTGSIYKNEIEDLQEKISNIENTLSDLLKKFDEVKRG
jgi:phosphatidylinositol kinase/protein kinase (PI-3  family)